MTGIADYDAVARYDMPYETAALKQRLAKRLRQTNWAAAGFAAVLQLGFLAVLMSMGVVPNLVPDRDKPLVTILATTPQQQPQPPAAPAPPRPEQPQRPVVRPQAEVIMPPPRIEIAAAAPVAAALERAPEPPTPAKVAPAAAAPATAPAAAETGPVKVANMSTNLLSSPVSYPAASKRKHEEGIVVLWIVISKDGRVIEASVQRTSGFPNLDDAALSAVRKWRWSPTMRDGKPVEIAGAVRIPFTLRKS